SLSVIVFPEAGIVILISGVASRQWWNLPIVYTPATLPPFSTLKPFWLFNWTTTGSAVSHRGPTGTGSPLTISLVICRVIFDVVATAPVFRFSLPVVLPTLMNRVVAVTGISPACLNEPVVSGMVRSAVRLPLAGFRTEAREPGPSGNEKFGPFRKVVPVIL